VLNLKPLELRLAHRVAVSYGSRGHHCTGFEAYTASLGKKHSVVRTDVLVFFWCVAQSIGRQPTSSTQRMVHASILLVEG